MNAQDTKPHTYKYMYVCVCAGILCYFVPRPLTDAVTAYTLPAIITTIRARHSLKTSASQIIAEIRQIKGRRAREISSGVTAYQYTDSIETPSFYPCPVAILETVPLNWMPFYIKLFLTWLKTGKDKRVFTSQYLRQAGGPNYSHRLQADGLFTVTKVDGGVTLTATDKLRHALPDNKVAPSVKRQPQSTQLTKPAATIPPQQAQPQTLPPAEFDAINAALKRLAAGDFQGASNGQ